MDAFQYKAIDLEGPSFRLLRLRKGTGFEIECTLFQSRLDDDDVADYEALSYCWGSTGLRRRIRVNGWNLLVTQNLYTALQYLRRPEVDRIIWVDAVCIDQDNNTERGHQIQYMRKIYSTAERVIFWLGLETDDSNSLMDSLRCLETLSLQQPCRDWHAGDERWRYLWLQSSSVNQLESVNERHRKGLEELLHRPWFRRVWILQEVANATKAMICCGNKAVSARVFSLAPLLIGTKPDVHCQAVLDIMPGPSRQSSWWNYSRDLYTLLQKFRESKATDPRDMIYALVGMASDDGISDALIADYSKPTELVIKDAFSFLFPSAAVGYSTMTGFLRSLHDAHHTLASIAASSSAHGVAMFLDHQETNIRILVTVWEAALGNENYGNEIISLLLERYGVGQNIPYPDRGGYDNIITELESLWKSAAGNKRYGEEMVTLLFEQSHFEYKKAISKTTWGSALMNKGCGLAVIRILLQRTSEDIHLLALMDAMQENLMGQTSSLNGSTFDTPEWIANVFHEIIALIFELNRQSQFVKVAARSSSLAVFEAPLRHGSSGELDVTDEVLKIVAGHPHSGRPMMDMLLENRPTLFMTDDIVEVATGNPDRGRTFMNHRVEERPTLSKTINAFEFAAGNPFDRGTVIVLLLQQRSTATSVTERVIERVVANKGCGVHVLTSLLYREMTGRSRTVQDLIICFIQPSDEHVILNILQRQRSERGFTGEAIRLFRRARGIALVSMLRIRGIEKIVTDEWLDVLADASQYERELAVEYLLEHRTSKFQHNQVEQAKDLFVCERLLGINHRLTVDCMAKLAETYKECGQLKKTEELYLKIINRRDRDCIRRVSPPLILISLANLALSYWDCNQREAARALMEKVVQKREEWYGPSDHKTFAGKRVLGKMYQ